MSGRNATVVAAGVSLVLCIAVAGLRPVPFVTTSPGPTVDTLGSVDGRPVVTIEGRRTYPTAGRLELTTVRVTSGDTRISLLQAVQAWFDPHREVLPRDVIYPPDRSVAQIEEQNAEEMQTSQQTAVVAALRELGVRVPAAVVVQSITEGAPALGHLRAGDVLRVVNGRPITAAGQVGVALQRTEPGETATFEVTRDGRAMTVTSPTQAAPDDPEHTLVGISVSAGYDLPFDVTVRIDPDIGGPSAGTMFALAILDKLTPGPLTGGAVVAGTGSISPDGQVGGIGGIQQKIVGAVDEGATVFLVPDPNCAAALNADISGIRLVQIRTLHGAVTALKALAEDPDAKVPACTS